jgi:signal transduction histidine kinase
VVLSVEDNGCGIEDGVALRPTSLGLLGVRERVLPFGGSVAIHGTPARGTTVTVTIPRAAAVAEPREWSPGPFEPQGGLTDSFQDAGYEDLDRR